MSMSVPARFQHIQRKMLVESSKKESDQQGSNMKYYFLLKEANKIESLTFGSGQHPYSPDESLQQVLPSGHDD